MLLELEKIAQTVKQRIDQHQTGGRTLTLKVKFSDYQQITRSKTVLTPRPRIECDRLCGKGTI
jgi:DNA polymerase IV